MKRFGKILVASILLVSILCSFASCGLFGSKLDKMEKRLDKKDYSITTTKDDDKIKVAIFWLLGVEVEGATVLLEAYNGDEEFYAVEFKTTADLNDCYDELLEAAEDWADDSEDDMAYGKSGKIVYVGTLQACKDAVGFPSSIFVTAKN